MKKTTKKKVAKKKVTRTGRPPGTWTVRGKKMSQADIIDFVCEQIEVSSLSVKAIFKTEPGMPDYRNFVRWIKKNEGFRHQYAQAKQAQAHYMAMEIIDICDNSTNDYMERINQDGEASIVANKENIQRSRLRVDTRKWLMSKLLPKQYGDKISMEHTGDSGGPVRVESVFVGVDADKTDKD